jgi:hypothetical protein
MEAAKEAGRSATKRAELAARRERLLTALAKTEEAMVDIEKKHAENVALLTQMTEDLKKKALAPADAADSIPVIKGPKSESKPKKAAPAEEEDLDEEEEEEDLDEEEDDEEEDAEEEEEEEEEEDEEGDEEEDLDDDDEEEED